MKNRHPREPFAGFEPPIPRRAGFFQGHDGIRLYQEEYGPEDAPPLILCDGLGCNGTFFVYLIPYLAKRMRVIRWTYRGHGLSDLPSPDNATVDDNIRDLFSLMDTLGISKCVLGGYSFGVQIVLDAATRRPSYFSALLLSNGTYGRLLDHFHSNSFFRMMFPFLYGAVIGFPDKIEKVWGTITPSSILYYLASMYEFNGRLVRREQLSAYQKHLASMDLGVLMSMLASAARHDTRSSLPGIKIPTFILSASRDTYTPPFLAGEIYEGMPNAELLEVKGSTHSLMLEQPDLVNLKVENFLVRKGILD